MKKLIIISVLIAICNFSSGQSSYIPMEKGATFTYAYGSELYQGAYDKMRFKIDILSTTKMINEQEYFIFETSSGSDGKYSSVATSYARTGTDGAVFNLQDINKSEYLTLKASPKVGDTWASQSGKLTSKVLVAHLDGTIETPYKTYTNCLTLEQKTEDGQIMKSYFQEDVGMVATTIVTDGSEKIFIYLVNE